MLFSIAGAPLAALCILSFVSVDQSLTGEVSGLSVLSTEGKPAFCRGALHAHGHEETGAVGDRRRRPLLCLRTWLHSRQTPSRKLAMQRCLPREPLGSRGRQKAGRREQGSSTLLLDKERELLHSSEKRINQDAGPDTG